MNIIKKQNVFYKMVREDLSAVKTVQTGKITAVKIALEENDEIIIQIPYDKGLIKEVRMISGKIWNLMEHKSSNINKFYSYISRKSPGKTVSPIDTININI